jgi:hypothetical protein
MSLAARSCVPIDHPTVEQDDAKDKVWERERRGFEEGHDEEDQQVERGVHGKAHAVKYRVEAK